MARSTPGYWTFTATTRPSGMTARCTWPMDAAAVGTGSQSRKSFSGSAPSSERITPSARLGAMGGTSAKATPTPTPAAPRRATPAAARGTSRRTVRSSRRAAARNRPPRVELRTLLVLEAEAGGGPGREALLVDRLAARLARAVRALVQALEGVLHVGQLGFDAFQDRQVLLPLERLGPEVGLVLVDGGELGQRLLLRLVGEVFVGEPLLGALEARPLFRS